MNRRTFTVQAAMAAAAVTILPSYALHSNKPVRLIFIGVGLRGQNHLELALRRKDVEVIALCDINSRMLEMATHIVKKSGKPMPKIHG